MCKQCVKEVYPQRERTCLDAGTYLLNWSKCIQCSSRDIPTCDARKVTTSGSCSVNYNKEDKNGGASVDPSKSNLTQQHNQQLPVAQGLVRGKVALVIAEEEESEIPGNNEDGIEETTYTHKCANCQHEIATHTHTFTQTMYTHENEMDCLLCGTGESQSRLWQHEEEEEQFNGTIDQAASLKSCNGVIRNHADPNELHVKQNAETLAKAVRKKDDVDGLLMGMNVAVAAVDDGYAGVQDVDEDEWEE